MIREYFNQRAAGWDETVAEKDTTKLERMAERLNIEPGSTILDVGTGTGVFLPFLLERVGEKGHIVALDFAEKMLRKSRDKNFEGNIDYLCTDVASISLRDGIFDLVVCYSSFPHFQDKPGVLTGLKRVIKSGGRLLVCHTSSRVTINEIHRQISVVQNDLLPDMDEMQLLLSSAGFTEIKVEDNEDSYLAGGRKPGSE